jgi:hypothetical protein
MRAPTAAELLDTWQDAVTATPARRAQALLRLAFPELDAGDSGALTIGQRDVLLMQLRRHLFGVRLDMVTLCPQCREPLESAADVDAFAATATAECAPAPLCAHGYHIAFRPPSVDDLLALPDEPDPRAARAHLLQRCISRIETPDGHRATPASLPEDVVQAVIEAMADADPAADLELAFDCPACGHAWTDCFDIAAFLWRELHAWALRTLREVHSLALAYGWREADVLALNPVRRQIYLELCRS